MTSDPRFMIALEHVVKRISPDFGINDLCLRITRGETLALLGPSGCGKTTTLRLIAGFEQPDAGAVLIDGKTVGSTHKQVPPHLRKVSMVFQDLALWPHMTVNRHLDFVLKSCRLDKKNRNRDIYRMLERVFLAEKSRAYPHQLSGGEKQRLALARALVGRPRILLMDEPLSNLDNRLRWELLDHIKRLTAEQRMTTLYVTHDHREAIRLADRIVLMENGTIAQTCASIPMKSSGSEIFSPENATTSTFCQTKMMKSLHTVEQEPNYEEKR